MKLAFILGITLLGTQVSAESLQGSTTSGPISPAPSSGLSTPQVNALLQAWNLNDTSNRTTSQLNFRLRRAEIKLSGKVADVARYFVMIDGAKTIATKDPRILQDLGVGFSITPELEVVAGQFKEPSVAESGLSSGDLPLPERSMLARRYGEQREPGVMVVYKHAVGRIAAMVSNGQGANADAKDVKHFSVRAEVPITRELQVGAFTRLSEFDFENNGQVGGGIAWKRDVVNLRAEYAMGRNKGITSHAGTLEGGYRISDNWESVVRYELIRPGAVDLSSVESIGVNYRIAKNSAKLQGAVSFLHDAVGKNGSYEPQKGSNGTLMTLAFQAAI